MPKFLFLCILFCSVPLLAVSHCEKRAAQLPKLSPTTDWSSDYYLKVISEVDQEFGIPCPIDKKVDERSFQLKNEYLSRLGFSSTEKAEAELLFRAFSVEQKVLGDLKKKKESLSPPPTTALGWVSGVYGMPARNFRGTVLIGKDEKSLSRLETWLNSELFDSRLLYRVMLVENPSLAAYVPELSTLLLSAELLNEDQILNRLVVTHELAHLTIRKKRITDGKKWGEEFRAFSGWKVSKGKWSVSVKEDGVRSDALTEQSQKSAFSVLPDTVLVSTTKGKDGFALAKSYRETKSRGEGDEDLADHIALAILLPERFCWKKAPLAPQKYAWIQRALLPSLSPLSCH